MSFAAMAWRSRVSVMIKPEISASIDRFYGVVGGDHELSQWL